MKVQVMFKDGDWMQTEVDVEDVVKFYKEVVSGNDWVITKDLLFKKEDVKYITEIK